MSEQPRELQDYADDFLAAHIEHLNLNPTRMQQSLMNLLINGCPKTNIACIDAHEEHSPSKEEWSVLIKNKTFKRFVKKLGGIESVKLVKSGSRPCQTNWNDVRRYLEKNPGCTLKSGWYIIIGKPTLIQFNVHFWIEKPDGSWVAISGEGDEHMCLATPKEDHVKFLFDRWAATGECMKSVVLNPCFPNHQTLDQFENQDGEWSVSRMNLPLPIPEEMKHMVNYEETKEEE